MEKIISLCKRRGFVFPGSDIYGGLANAWDYGPLGVELKNNIKAAWWSRFVHQRDDVVGIDAALIMNPKVWEASGHLKEFSDPLIECKKCRRRFRADHVDGKKCPECGGELAAPKQFNLMFKTFLGPAQDQANIAYFRPETAQAMFVDFKQVFDTTRKRIPFGIAQMGKAFRNEITPGNFIFRTREFEQMEIEYFIRETDWQEQFEHWQQEMWAWATDVLGLKKEHIHEVEVPDGERAHYSQRTVDFEYEFPFGKKELYGLAYRGDFDLQNHMRSSGQDLSYTDPETQEKFVPHVIEPTFGVDRSILAVLSDAYSEESDRVVLKLKPSLAPYKVAVFPLLKNKPELVAKAKEVYHELKKHMTATFDDRGNIGKRYYSQDEIGTPFCVTVDFDSLEHHDATLRDRDTMQQVRVKISDLADHIKNQLT